MRKPRICLPTSRTFTRKPFQCGFYEAQDVLAEMDDVDLIFTEPGPGFDIKESWQRRLLYHDVSRRLIFQNPGLRKVRLNREYDLFAVLCPNYWDLLYINAIEGWEDHCKTSVCWIDEMWAAELPLHKHWLHALQRFDHVFVGLKGSVEPLSKAIGRPCRWLPGAVDTLRFSPYPAPPSRVIDVYSMGRRWEGIHRTLLQAAARQEIFYVYDTLPVFGVNLYDYQQHRDLFANVAKRSRYFMVAPAKMDTQEETQSQIEIGSRYYEGAAAGAVMIGQPPKSETFRELFNWPDVVMRIEPDGSDVAEVLAALDSDPLRASAIRGRNAAQALLRHDWVYRWKELLGVAGLEPSPGLEARERCLQGLAAQAGVTA